MGISNIIGILDNTNTDLAVLETEALLASSGLVNEFTGTNTINKVYYISVLTGKVFVTVSDEDKVLLYLSSNLVGITDVQNFLGKTNNNVKITSANLSNKLSNKTIEVKESLIGIVSLSGISNNELILQNIFGKKTFTFSNTFSSYLGFKETKKISPVGTADFGYSCAINSTKFVIGDPDAGTIYIYDLDGNNEIKITPENPGFLGPVSYFSINISMNESTILVGTRTSKAYLYDLEGNLLFIIDNHEHSYGQAVLIRDRIVIGDWSKNKAYVYTLSGDFLHIINGSGNFPTAMDMDGEKLLIKGNYGQDGISVYDYNGELIEKILPDINEGLGNKNILIKNNKYYLGGDDGQHKAFMFDPVLNIKTELLSTHFIQNVVANKTKVVVSSQGWAQEVFIFNSDGTNRQSLKPILEVDDDKFSRSLCMNEDTLVVCSVSGAYLFK